MSVYYRCKLWDNFKYKDDNKTRKTPHIYNGFGETYASGYRYGDSTKYYDAFLGSPYTGVDTTANTVKQVQMPEYFNDYRYLGRSIAEGPVIAAGGLLEIGNNALFVSTVRNPNRTKYVTNCWFNYSFTDFNNVSQTGYRQVSLSNDAPFGSSDVLKPNRGARYYSLNGGSTWYSIDATTYANNRYANSPHEVKSSWTHYGNYHRIVISEPVITHYEIYVDNDNLSILCKATNTLWYKIVYSPSDFADDAIPRKLFLILQGAGGGGAGTNVWGDDEGGGGGGSGATVYAILNRTSTIHRYKYIIDVGVGGKGGDGTSDSDNHYDSAEFFNQKGHDGGMSKLTIYSKANSSTDYTYQGYISAGGGTGGYPSENPGSASGYGSNIYRGGGGNGGSIDYGGDIAPGSIADPNQYTGVLYYPYITRSDEYSSWDEYVEMSRNGYVGMPGGCLQDYGTSAWRSYDNEASNYCDPDGCNGVFKINNTSFKLYPHYSKTYGGSKRSGGGGGMTHFIDGGRGVPTLLYEGSYSIDDWSSFSQGDFGAGGGGAGIGWGDTYEDEPNAVGGRGGDGFFAIFVGNLKD